MAAFALAPLSVAGPATGSGAKAVRRAGVGGYGPAPPATGWQFVGSGTPGPLGDAGLFCVASLIVGVKKTFGDQARTRKSRAGTCRRAGGADKELKLIAGEKAIASGVKMVHFMRHGEAVVNAAGRVFPKGDPRKSAVRQDPQYFDSPLSEKGLAQSAALRAGTLEGRSTPPKVDVVIVSPLTRAIQTATAAFGCDPSAAAGHVPKLVVTEALREFCSKAFQPCDQRRSREEQQLAFPFADFQNVPPGPDTLLGPGLVETPEHADMRIRQLLAWLRDQPYRSIACVAHFQILSRILSEHLEPAGYDGTKYGDLTNLEIRSVPIRFESDVNAWASC